MAPDREAVRIAPPEGRMLAERQGYLLLIIVDRPRKLNAFSPEMLEGLSDAFTRLEHDPSLRCGVLLAEGPHFTAGLELDRLASRFAAGEPLFPPGRVDPVSLRPPIRSKPLVCAVQGICFTLGVELMLAADIVVAAADCRFSQLEVKRGIMANQGATIRWIERAGWGNAQRYLLTGDEFDVLEAQRLGLVQEVVPVGAERNRALELATSIAQQAPLAVQATLASCRRSLDAGPVTAAAELAAIQRELCASDDFEEGVRSFQERRAAVFLGR